MAFDRTRQTKNLPLSHSEASELKYFIKVYMAEVQDPKLKAVFTEIVHKLSLIQDKFNRDAMQGEC